MTQIPRGPDHLKCPFWQDWMSNVCHTCPNWIQIRGKHPQSNEEIDRWDCSVAITPILIIESAQMSRQTGAAVESFRNEMVRQNLMIIEQSQDLKRISNAQ